MLQLAEQLRAVGVPAFPCWAEYNDKKGKWDKGPAVPKGEPWQLTALRPVDDPVLSWASNILGVPIPAGIFLIDLDVYRGSTRQAIEAAVGCTLPWDDAFIQTTIGGGEHYAFRCPWEARQGDSLEGVEGFDTRAAGRGFICAGKGYTPVKHGGVLAFGNPQALPELPAACQRVLGKRGTTPTPALSFKPPQTDNTEIIEALKHIDPSCSRTQWRNVGYGLKALYKDDDLEGMYLFEQWSSGELWGGAPPDNYVADGKGSVADQWPTFNAEGGVSPSTLYYWAIRGGWQPPARFDAASAFGRGAAPADTFNALVERIRHKGGDIKNTAGLVEAIQTAGCNSLQVALLAAELKTELSNTGLKDKTVTGHIDGLLRTKPPADMVDRAPPGMYGKNDTDNAVVFLEKFYPSQGLVKCDGEFYEYTGFAWRHVTADVLKSKIYKDMAAQRMQESKMAACYRTVSNVLPVYDGLLNTTPGHLVIFTNGVLNLQTGEIGPHSRELFSTNIMPYAWQPAGQCPQWLAFLNDVFSNDGERVALLQEWFGYMLGRDYSFHKIMFLLGGPRCGKGTIGRVLSALVGSENFSGGRLSKFADDSFLASLRTRTVVFIGDAAKRVPTNKVNEVTENLKAISGNDEVSFDRKFLSSLSQTLPSRITFAANNVPQLFDDSGALASRLLLLTFDKSYLGNEDRTLGDRLLTEIEGIATWAVAGWRRLQQAGQFTEPATCADEIRDIKESYAPLQRFVADCCIADDRGWVSITEIYEAYRVWALHEGDDITRRKTFISSLKDALRGSGVLYEPHHIDGELVRGFKGLRLGAVAEERAVQPAAALAFSVAER